MVKRRPHLVTGTNIYSAKLHNDLVIFFRAESEALVRKLTDICEKNAAYTGSNALGFYYQDQAYYSPTIPAVTSITRTRHALDERLHDDMDVYLAQDTMVTSSISRIRSVFSAGAVRCTDDQDYRDMFPDVLWSNTDNKILELGRTRDVGFLLTNRVLHRQFQHGVDLLYYHQFNKLVT